MNNELISIIVPIFNNEKYLNKCIDSLLDQSYQNIEIILVNDGSMDKSPKICDEYAKKDKRIRVIHKKNTGVSDSRNVGIENSKGIWITFVDSDDWVETNYCEYLHNIAVKNNSDMSLTFFPNKVKENNIPKNNIVDKIVTFNRVEAIKTMLYYKIVISSWNKMYKSNIIKNNNLKFNNNINFGEGFEFVISYFINCNRIVIGKEKIYNYRVDNENSVMTKISKRLISDSIKSQDLIESKVINIDKSINQACIYSKWHTYCDCFSTIVGSKKINEYKDEYNFLYNKIRKNFKELINSPVGFKEKIKILLYYFNPLIAAKIINKLRLRKFTK